MVALTYNENRRDKMDVQGLISDLGVPIATSLAMMWGCFYLIKYITGQHTEMMNNKFEYLTGIIVKLIDQQKLMQIQLSGLEKSQKTMERITIDIIGKLMDKDGGNGFKTKLEKFLKEN